MRQIPLAIGPAPVQTFDGFVPGANAAALAHLRALAASLPHAPAPVYLWGTHGSGKTHLLRWLALHLPAAARVVAVSAEHGPTCAFAAVGS